MSLMTWPWPTGPGLKALAWRLRLEAEAWRPCPDYLSQIVWFRVGIAIWTGKQPDRLTHGQTEHALYRIPQIR